MPVPSGPVRAVLGQARRVGRARAASTSTVQTSVVLAAQARFRMPYIRSCLDMPSSKWEDWHHEVRESAEMSDRRADGSYSKTWRRISQIILRPSIRALMKHDWQGQ